MRLSVVRHFSDCKGLWTDGAVVLAAQGLNVVELAADGTEARMGVVPASLAEAALSRWRITRQGLRLGIHHLRRLPDGGLLAVANRRILRADGPRLPFRVVEPLRVGHKPAAQGVLVTERGCVLYAEYSINADRKTSHRLYRSDDAARTFAEVYAFPPTEAAHIHFIQEDPFTGQLWLGTGDADHECLLLASDDGGGTWSVVGGGAQTWRAVGLAFTADALVWGTDAGSDNPATTPNHIVRLARGSVTPEIVQRVQGPCHGVTATGEGWLVVSTGVEGGPNEQDGDAHIWASRDGLAWTDVQSWPKDRWPHLMQYGVVRFPSGQHRSALVWFTTYGLRGAGETLHAAEIVDT